MSEFVRGHLSAGEVSPSGVLAPLYKAGLKPGVNWRRDLTQLISEIAVRENLTCRQVLKAPEIEAILIHKKLSAPQKLERIKEILFARRYPAVALARKAFNKELKKLKLSPKIKVKYHPFFENDKLTIEIKRRSVIPSVSEESLDICDSEIMASLKKLQGADLIKNALKIAEDNS